MLSIGARLQKLALISIFFIDNFKPCATIPILNADWNLDILEKLHPDLITFDKINITDIFLADLILESKLLTTLENFSDLVILAFQ